MKKHQYLLDSAQASSNRTRTVIFLIMLTSFLSGVALWNELESSWLRNRQLAVKRCLEWFVFNPQTYTVDKENKFKVLLKGGDSNYTYVDKILTEDFKIPPWTEIEIPKYLKKDSITPQILKEIKAAALLIRLRPFYTEEQAKAFLNALTEAEVLHRLSVRIPILGIVFDINDLAVISGAAFNILLFVFWFSLARERKSIKFIFQGLYDKKATSKRKVQEIYSILALKQVFHIPPELPRKFSSSYDLARNRFVNRLTFPIVLLPFLTHLSIFIYDRVSNRYTLAIDASLSIMLLLVSLFLLLVNLWLTVMCANQWTEITRVWREQHFRICHAYNMQNTEENLLEPDVT